MLAKLHIVDRYRSLVSSTHMTHPPCLGTRKQGTSVFWMRAVSFAGLYRLLRVVADFPKGLRASEIDTLVRKERISLTLRGSTPSRATLYHYRNTLLQIRALRRSGPILTANTDNPAICELLRQPPLANGDRSLSGIAMDRFAELVLRNEQCRSLFFNLFNPPGVSMTSVSDFRQKGIPVKWRWQSAPGLREAVLENSRTGLTASCNTRVSVTSILHGVRYWARDELKLIDEYCQQADGTTVMFPLAQTVPSAEDASSVVQTAHFLLSLRTVEEWTLFSILDLIVRCCEEQRLPIDTLFRSIDWLIRKWPNHIVLIPTSRSLATLTATSPQRERLALRRYYKAPNALYISHIRIHKDVKINDGEAKKGHG